MIQGKNITIVHKKDLKEIVNGYRISLPDARPRKKRTRLRFSAENRFYHSAKRKASGNRAGTGDIPFAAFPGSAFCPQGLWEQFLLRSGTKTKSADRRPQNVKHSLSFPSKSDYLNISPPNAAMRAFLFSFLLTIA